MQDTLTSGYFELLGTLSRRKEGLESVFLASIAMVAQSHKPLPRRLLEKFKLFTVFYSISELKNREDLVVRLIDNLDYSMCVMYSEVEHPPN